MQAATAQISPTARPVWFDRVPEFRGRFRGSVLLPTDPGYDAARKLYNAMIDRRPALIAQCRDEADVVSALRFAQENGLPTSVRGGGHGVSGSALVDDGLVIDLSAMRAVWVDPATREARVQGGALWGDVDHATQLHGLAVPGGLVSNTGVGGFTLGGGVGWSSRMFGLACDNVTEFELVTARGELIRVNSRTNPDLLWALRGAGANFGVVTGFRFRLHPIGPMVYGGLRIFPGDRAASLLRFVRDLHARAPDELNVALILTTLPPAPMIPPEWQGKPAVALVVAYLGPDERAEAATREIRAIPDPILEQVGPMPYTALQSLPDALAPPGLQNYWKSLTVAELPDAAIRALVDRFRTVPSPLTEVHLHYFGGGAVAAAADGSALGNRDAPFLLNFVGRWTDPAEKDRHVGFIRGLWETMRPFATGGVYVNFLADQSSELLRAAYGEEGYRRLRSLKGTYDPENRFRGSLNIAP